MRIGTLGACALVALVAVSCNENSQAPSQNTSSAASAVKSGGGSQGSAAGSGQASAGSSQAGGRPDQHGGSQPRQTFQSPVPPADAKWTILCEEFNDPAH